MKRVVAVLVVFILMVVMVIPLVPIRAQSYLSRGYCSVSLQGSTLYFCLVNPSSETIRHVYQTSQHIDYFVFGKRFYYHYGDGKDFMQAITYIDVSPSGRVLVDTFSLPDANGPYYIYVDFLVCQPRLYVVEKGVITEEIPSLFAIRVDTNGYYFNIGQTLSVTVSLISRVPLGDKAYIDLDFSPNPVLTVFYEDGSIDSETFTGTTVRLSGGEDILFIKRIRVKNPIKAVYVLLDGVSFTIGSHGQQYIEKMPPVAVPVYTIKPWEEPVITDVPYWAQDDVFYMYEKHILPKSVFVGMEDSITREDLIRGIASIMHVPAMSFSHTFSDVRKYVWGSYLAGMQWYHLLSGFPDGTVKGDSHLTRAQMAVLLARILPPKPGKISFADVKQSDWYYQYIKAIAGYGILKGWNGKFYPNKTLSKAEATVILRRIMSLVKPLP